MGVAWTLVSSLLDLRALSQYGTCVCWEEGMETDGPGFWAWLHSFVFRPQAASPL